MLFRWPLPLLGLAAVLADDYETVPGLQRGQPLFDVPLTVEGEDASDLVVKVGDRINMVAKQWCIENNARSSEVGVSHASCLACADFLLSG